MREKIEEKRARAGAAVRSDADVRPASSSGAQGAFDAMVHATPQVAFPSPTLHLETVTPYLPTAFVFVPLFANL